MMPTSPAAGAAELLVEHARTCGAAAFLLQPAEEKPPGGAKVLIEQGHILDGVDAALARVAMDYVQREG